MSERPGINSLAEPAGGATHSARGGGGVLVVGSGVAGATVARVLADRGRDVLVLDKGRGPGGRCSTRRGDYMSVDHGAQYFTATDARLLEWVRAWEIQGVLAKWSGPIVDITGGCVTDASPRDRWVGVPGMSRVVANLLEGVDVRFNANVVSLEQSGGRWSAALEDGGTVGGYEQLVVALPAPQAAGLLASAHPAFGREAGGVPFDPCWAVMLVFNQRLGLPFDGAKIRDGACLSWVSRNNAKPGRDTDQPEAWVLHASHDWSKRHVESDRDQVGDALLEAFRMLASGSGVSLPPPTHIRAHRWRYARTGTPLGRPCLHDAAIGLTVCGDWLLGGRIEAAFLSGFGAAEALGSG